MKQITFVINSPLYVRNYIESELIALIAKRYEVSLLVREDIEITNLSGISGIRNILFYKRDQVLENKKYITFNILMHKLKYMSSSFRFRISRGKILQKHEWQQAKTPKDYLRVLVYILMRSKGRLSCFIYSLLPTKLIYRFIGSNLVNDDFKNKLFQLQSDLVILPSSAYASEDIDFSIVCRELKVPSLLLVDNWDNMSSKSILWQRPDFVAVWGEQSKKHAVNIQKFLPDQVFIIGTARYASYFELRNENLNSHFNFKYVLFVGTALAFNESKVLEILNHEIDSNDNIYQDTRIVYRPHPWRQGHDSIAELNLGRVALDPQIYDFYLNRKHDDLVQPELNYYPSLLKNSMFVVGGMTSMIIEAQIFYKSVIGLIHEEKDSPTSPRKVFREYEHFRGLENLSSLALCNDLRDLPRLFRSTFLREISKDEAAVDKVRIDNERNYFLYNDQLPYHCRLDQLISKV